MWPATIEIANQLCRDIYPQTNTELYDRLIRYASVTSTKDPKTSGSWQLSVFDYIVRSDHKCNHA